MDPNVTRILDNVTSLVDGITNLNELQCTEIKLSYQNYVDLLDGLTSKSLTIQKTLPLILHKLDSECCIPTWISNLTRKVRRFVLKNSGNPEKLNSVIDGLYSNKTGDEMLHPDFRSQGNRMADLVAGEPIKTKPDFVMKHEHVLNLRKIIVLKSLPWSRAVEWTAAIQDTRPPNVRSLTSQWARLYAQSLKEKLCLKSSKYADFLNQIYKVPVVCRTLTSSRRMLDKATMTTVTMATITTVDEHDGDTVRTRRFFPSLPL